MEFDNKKYKISYGIVESFDDKIMRLEKLPQTTFTNDFNINDKKKEYFHLYHGLRFNGVDKLESIIQSGYILCGKEIKQTFQSYDGSEKQIISYSDDLENCNRGRYISVIPSIPFDYNNLEFSTFIQENLFLELECDIDALSTFFLNFDDYMKLRLSGTSTRKLYSYALREYMVKNKIPLSKIISIGIDSDYYVDDVMDTINKVNAIKEYYGVNIPFYDKGHKRLVK